MERCCVVDVQSAQVIGSFGEEEEQEVKSETTRLGLVATLSVLSFGCFMASGLMWVGSVLPETVVLWVMVATGASFCSAFTLGVAISIIGSRARMDDTLSGSELDERGLGLGVEREKGEKDPMYRRRIQRHAVTRETKSK